MSLPAKPTADTVSRADAASFSELRQMSSRLAPTPLVVDVSQLGAGDRKALVKLIEAARVLDDIYLEQAWSGNAALLKKLRADRSALGRARLNYFLLNKGPWSELDGHTAFLPGVPAKKPAGANFYPESMTAAAFDAWVAGLGKNEADAAKGFYSVIRERHDNAPGDISPFEVLPYSHAYHEQLSAAARLLREAAVLTGNASLRHFLRTRADALASDDYFESDVAWMDLDAPLDITFGPYETYGDELFGYKAAFEAYVNIQDAAETAKLGYFSRHLQELEDQLPEDPKFRNAKLGALSPIRVVNEVFSAGDGAHGVQTSAYNLPNDDRVVQQKGSKRVMLKNVQQAKFTKILQPIAQVVLAPGERQYLSFDWFFTHILAHELMHGLGPHQITVAGRETNPRLELKNIYGAIEETKADVTGLWALQYLLDHAEAMGFSQVIALDANAEKKLYTTYLTSLFRELRFGLTEAHARGVAVQINFLLDQGALRVNAAGQFEIDYATIKTSVRTLDTVLLTVEAQGDFAAASKLLESAVLRPEVATALAKLGSIPVDIAPVFVTAEKLAPSPQARAVHSARR